uniref:Capsid protein n=1 Tax=Parvoviridae sp. TaxID=1940570 RepID=A0A7D3UW26_9VIRU|nr:MAG: capsid protein [Parvoviridae sp.]QKE54884.1 MAG: capsid protein [Parvoviridae sp.]
MFLLNLIGRSICPSFTTGMVDTQTISNTYMAYIKNQPYIYPPDNDAEQNAVKINTGWHIIPAILWKHFVNPRQFAELIIKYQSYKVDGIKIKVYNMIPMTTQLAIQSTTIFTSFNNTVYGLGYTDNHYETSWYNWFNYDDSDQLNLLCKEGLMTNYGKNTKRRFVLPIYEWQIPNARAHSINTYNNANDIGNNLGNANKQSRNPVFPTGTTQNADNTLKPQQTDYNRRPTGLLWDPLNKPSDIMELRPGKNMMSFGWSVHPSDAHLWFNLDTMAWWYPYTPEGPYHVNRGRPGQGSYEPYCDPDKLAQRYEYNPHVNDYTIPNFANLPVVPSAWWWQEMGTSIYQGPTFDRIRYLDMLYRGTEKEQALYPPTQFFLKMIPLFDENGTHIELSSQIVIQTELILSCKVRQSAYYAPTWGPFNWHKLYSARAADRFFEPATIRYRTAGMRRTWQNMQQRTRNSHPRTTPLDDNTENPDGEGVDQTRRYRPYRPMRRSATPSAPPMETEPEDPAYQRLDPSGVTERVSGKLL